MVKLNPLPMKNRLNMHFPLMPVLGAGLLLACVLLWTPAFAHPFLTGEVTLNVEEDLVRIEMKVVLLQICLVEGVPSEESGVYPAKALKAAVQKHGAYLLERLGIVAGVGEDLLQLKGSVADVKPPECEHPLVYHDSLEKLLVTYELVYPLKRKPDQLIVIHRLLEDVPYMPGTTWEETLILSGFHQGRAFAKNVLLMPAEAKVLKLPVANKQEGTTVEGSKKETGSSSKRLNTGLEPVDGIYSGQGQGQGRSAEGVEAGKEARAEIHDMPREIWGALMAFSVLALGGWLRWRMIR